MRFYPRMMMLLGLMAVVSFVRANDGCIDKQATAETKALYRSMLERTKTQLRKTIADTYDRGGVTTVTWHFINPVTPQTGFYWKDSESAAAVKDIIPQGAYHQKRPERDISLTIVILF